MKSSFIGHVAAPAHLGPCERPEGRNDRLNIRDGFARLESMEGGSKLKA